MYDCRHLHKNEVSLVFDSCYWYIFPSSNNIYACLQTSPLQVTFCLVSYLTRCLNLQRFQRYLEVPNTQVLNQQYDTDKVLPDFGNSVEF